MSATHLNVSLAEDEQPISRTYQYRKVMKPMLERKRRARINRCLDELKELMSSALAAEGENLTKLEKADVLELTVRHLHKLRERQALGLNPAVSAASYADKFRAGFTHCAAEVSRYLATSTGLDVTVGQRLLSHLGRCVHQMEANTVAASTPLPPSPANFAFATSPAPFPVFGATYTPPSSPTLDTSRTSAPSVSQQRSSSSSPLLSPVSSPSLSESEQDYAKFSIRSDMMFSPTTAMADNGKVWRPW